MENASAVARGIAVATYVLAATFAASSASAQGGMNLSWIDCGNFGTVARTFACTSNTTTASTNIVLSAVAGVDMPQLNGEETILYIQTNTPTLSPWWHLEAGGCRGPSAVSLSYDFTAGSSNCLDPWAGQASGSMTFAAGDPAPAFARIQTDGGIPGTTSITGTEEYYLWKLHVFGDKSTGTGSCAGCTDAACIVLYSVTLTQPAGAPGGNVRLTVPASHNYVSWQNIVPAGICGVVPTRTTTWGSIKSLYR